MRRPHPLGALRRLPVRSAVSLLAVLAISGPLAASTSTAGPVPDRTAGQVTARVATPAPSYPANWWNRTNPLAGVPWGVYQGNADQAWPPYAAATGETRRLLGKIALRPKGKWFGAWIRDADIGRKVHDYIDNATQGDPDVLVQMTVFRVKPWEHDACTRLPTWAERVSHKRWIDRFAAAVGDTRVALVLQPDGPFAGCAPGGSTRLSRMISYAARTFSALPRTGVYIDAGASDWPKGHPEVAATLLERAGVASTRGFALNSTHYESTENNVVFGAEVIRELNARGIRGKHFVINTAENGRPFEFKDAKGSHPDNADVCRTTTETSCVTLGIPPTTRIDADAWALSDLSRSRARRYVDAYLWFGRPWLFMQADPFVMDRALAIARTTPY